MRKIKTFKNKRIKREPWKKQVRHHLILSDKHLTDDAIVYLYSKCPDTVGNTRETDPSMHDIMINRDWNHAENNISFDAYTERSMEDLEAVMEKYGFPESLKDCIRFAAEHGITAIDFQEDDPDNIVPELPIYK